MARIVVGVDGSAASGRALDWAIDEGKRRGTDVEAVHVWQQSYALGTPPYSVPAYVDPELLEKGARELLDRVVEGAGGSARVKRTLICGAPSESLLKAAEGADLLVVGTRGLGGFKELLLGSVSHQLAHHTSCPLVIVP